MKMQILKEALLAPLEMAAGAVDRRSTEEISSHVLIASEQGQLKVTGVGKNVQLTSVGAFAGAENIEITLPARKLLDICKTLPEGCDIRLETSGDQVEIKAGKTKLKLRFLAGEQFPIHAPEQPEATLEATAGLLRQMLARTAFSIGRTDVRRYLTGLLLEANSEAEELRMVATDGHRLAMSSCPLPPQALQGKAPQGRESDPFQVILPQDMTYQMRRVLDPLPFQQKIQLDFNEKSVRIVTANAQVQAQVINEKFPEYERVIPSTEGQVLTFEREPFKEILSRAVVLVDDHALPQLDLHLDKNTMLIRAKNTTGEDLEEDMDIEYAGEAMHMMFNLHFLREIIDSSSNSKFCMYVTDPASSARIEPLPDQEEDKLKTVYVLMPIRSN